MSTRIRFIRNFLSVTMVLAFVLTTAGCLSKPYKKVYAAAEAYAEAIVQDDLDEIIDMSDPDISRLDKNTITELMDYSESFNKDIYDCIRESFSYKIDVSTLSATGGKGSVKVIFDMIDWTDIADGNGTYENTDSIVESLNKSEMMSLSVNLSLKLVKSDWVVMNSSDIVSEIYEFTNNSISSFSHTTIVPEYYKLNDTVRGTWWSNYDIVDCEFGVVPVMENTGLINLDLSNYNNPTDVYYVVIRDNEIVYTSSTDHCYGYYGINQDAEINDDYCLVDGTYTIAFYDGDTLILSGTCVVTTTEES